MDGESKKMKPVYRIRTYDGTYKYVMNNNYVDRQQDGTLGLELIDTLASQLKGDYSYRSLESSTEFSLSFEKIKVKGSGSYINRGSTG
jgi:hypothetical protein